MPPKRKSEPQSPESTPKKLRSSPRGKSAKVKDEAEEALEIAESVKQDLAADDSPVASPSTPNKSQIAKKLKGLEMFMKTPFPDYKRPTPEECQQVCDALAEMHTMPERPAKIEKLDNVAANCGQVPSVLDALVRTILSQNTSNGNSTAARKSIEDTFGEGPNYEAVRLAPQEDLEEAIRCGGLSKIKSKVIKKILDQTLERYGKLSLDHLHDATDEESMRELVSFDGVGPKTASCVLLFCLGRESFAVDTHVFRITKALGWTPAKADRETAFQHLDAKIPGPLKYPLHAMLVRHGRECKNCAANTSPTKEQKDKCPIKSFLSARPTKALEKDGSPKGDDLPSKDGDYKSPKTPSKRGRKPKAKKEESDESEEDVKPKAKSQKVKKETEGDMHGL